ncbi:hypothetical protein ACWD0Z_26505 [Streptomyces sp. NPDC003007]
MSSRAAHTTRVPPGGRGALAYRTPARNKAVRESVGPGPTGPKAKPWRGTPMKALGRLFVVNSTGSDT